MSPEETLMDQTLKLLGIHPVRHKPNKVWAAEITRDNISGLAEWINENTESGSDKAAIQYDDETPIMWIGGRLASIGMVLMRGTIGEFYAIEKQVYLNAYEDVPQWEA